MIEVQDIAVKKGGRNIIQDVRFQLPVGTITVAIGKNGAGKSTLLEALTGSNPLTAGTIRWNQRKLRHWKMAELATHRAVLSQKVTVNFPITVQQLVEMGAYAAVQPLAKNEIDLLVKKALMAVEMIAFSERDFRTLSGGEQKRILLAKCLVQLNCNPQMTMGKYLFLDEPTASLDVQQQFKLLALIKQVVKEQQIGIFAVLHDINLAAQIANRILLMKKGQIIHQGAPHEVLTTANIRETLEIETIIQPHPILDCPYILPLATGQYAALMNG